MDNNHDYSEMIQSSVSYKLGYGHGMLAVNELVESLQRKLAHAKDEVNRLQEILQDRN